MRTTRAEPQLMPGHHFTVEEQAWMVAISEQECAAFPSPAAFLVNSWWHATKDGRLDRRYRGCELYTTPGAKHYVATIETEWE